MQARPLLLATTNSHKLREITQLWRSLPFEILTLQSFPHFRIPIEDGTSFAQNALLKARAAFEQTGVLSVAEDSGLEIDLLEGRPGIYSARYAGEQATDQKNLAKVIQECREACIGSEKQIPLTARYRCAAAIVGADGQEELVQDALEGQIQLHPQGENGFGYDPIFYLPSHKKTMAQIDNEQKNQISHRAKVFLALKEKLKQFAF